METYTAMTGQLSTTHSFDGADQGFLASYFPDLLDSPLFRPLPPDSGRLNGTFRLPMGYQMDHIYYCECGARFACLFVCVQVGEGRGSVA